MEPDPECSDFISPGRDVPPKYYLTNQTETSKEQMDRVTVGRGSAHKASSVVEEAGSTLQWEFFSTDYDVSFSMYLKRRVGDKKEKTTIVRRKPVSGFNQCCGGGGGQQMHRLCHFCFSGAA